MINQVELERKQTKDKQYLVYHCTSRDEVDKVELEMLSQNDIAGVCAFSIVEEEEETCYYYDVTGMADLGSYISRCKNAAALEALCASVQEALEEANEYMLFPQHYVAIMGYVMVQEEKPKFVVLPMNRFNSQQVSQADFLQPVQEKLKELQQASGETESAKKEEGAGYQAVIVQNSTGSRITIDKKVFKLGRDGHQVDYMIKNPVVGRLHATIYLEEDGVYIVDAESKNGTYLGNDKLESGKKVALKKGDVFRLGTEEFTLE